MLRAGNGRSRLHDLEDIRDLVERIDDLQGVDRVLRLVHHAEAARTVSCHLLPCDPNQSISQSITPF